MCWMGDGRGVDEDEAVWVEVEESELVPWSGRLSGRDYELGRKSQEIVLRELPQALPASHGAQDKIGGQQ